MRTRVLRFIVVVWLIASPLNVTLGIPRAMESIPADAANPIEWRSPIVLRPPLRPLSAGTPQTITVQVVPNTLIANSGATATITATVYDITNDVVDGANLAGDITSGRGAVGSFPPTGQSISGTTTSVWTATAGSTVGTGMIRVFTGTVWVPGNIWGSALITLTADVPNTVALVANPTNLTVGLTSTLTATVLDQYNNPVENGTLVTFTSDIGTPLSPRPTINGIATSSLRSTVAGTAHITATDGSHSISTPVTFNAGAPAILTLSPSTATSPAGTRITYTAIATDTYGNPLGNVTAGTSFSISPGSGGTFVGNAITPTVRGTYTVTGTNVTRGTATLTINPATYSRLSIETAPDGSGVPINAYTMSVYGTLTAYAVGYDVYSNTIGSQTANWGGTGVIAGRLAPTTNSSSTTFTAAVSGTGTITATSGASTDATGVITVQAPVLRISKSDSRDPVDPGTQFYYTIAYTNSSAVAAQGVIITETYPPSTTYAFATRSPDTGTNNVWSIGDLAAGASGTFDVYVNVPGQMPVGSVLTNTVRIGASRAATAIYTATTQVNAQPSLSVDVADSIDPVRPGQEFVYTILYRNDGNAPATGLRITETYPSQVTYVSANPSPSVGTNVWLPSTLNGGGTSRVILVTVRVNSPVADGTIMTNQVTIDSNETAPSAVTEQTLVTAPTLQLTKSANPVVPAANSLLTYTLRYTNSGSSYAANTIITDALPANTSFVQCVPIGCSVNGSIVTWDLGTLSQQTSNAVTLIVRTANNLPNGTVITNTARIASTEQVSAMAQLISTIASAPEIVLSKSDGLTEIAADQLTTYTLSFSNTGTAPAAGVVITDRIPNYTTFVACSSCVAAGSGVYSFTVGRLDANQSGAVTMSLRLAPTLPAGLRAITNTAAISTATSGDAPANNSALDVNNISTRPGLGLGATYAPNTPYPGKIITYTLRYTNTSAMDTIGVVITTTRPAWLGSTPPGWTHSGGIDSYSIGPLAARQSGSVTYVMTLPPAFTAAMNAFTMTFVLQDSGPGGWPAAQAQVVPVIGVPDVTIERVILPTAFFAGQKFTATVVIRNTGMGRACNPSNCGGFWIDVFVAPPTPPPSYPYTLPDGDFNAPVVLPIAAGQAVTINVSNIIILPTQKPLLYFKVDNFNCSPSSGVDPCLPSHSLGGLVPESNEYNNVAAVSIVTVYLPLVTRGKP